MKKILLCFCLGSFLLSCNDDKDKGAITVVGKPSVDLPYTASYGSNFTTDVSDADLKTVMMSYKNWADGDMSALSATMGDTVTVDMSSGDHLVKTNADLMKMWGDYRDSLSSVTIDMQAWQKMYSNDHKEGHVIAWYKEIDTFKSGKVDSAYYSDINRVKDGKIVWYAQYKRPAK